MNWSIEARVAALEVMNCSACVAMHTTSSSWFLR